MTSEYRPEIDGMRAIAIVPVVLFHFGLTGLDGGFVGVDVFFVISGFLIGGILWNELRDTGRVRLGRFFLRRIRRLAPAYYVMALGSFIAGWFILLPFEFREFGKELIAATVYLSNVFFWLGAGYFDVLGEDRVLLHTWSLAVEEQFYLFLPIFMIILARLRKALPWMLLALALISLVACVVVTERAHATAFYLFPFRAWELLAGVLLAIYGRETGFRWQVHAGLSWAGLGLILLAVVILESGESFPGAWALLPVLGTVFLIANGQDDNPVNRMLTTPVFLFFGAISYSLYLWHWPVVTLAKYYVGDALGLMLSAALIVLSIALAWVSLRLVENPVRKNGIGVPVLLSGYVLASVAVLGIGATLYLKDGLIQRFGPEAAPAILATRGFHQNWSRCYTPSEGGFSGTEICPIGPEGDPKLLIWGDSHARAFKEGLEQAAFDHEVPALLIWRGGCPPLLGLAKDESVWDRVDDEACTTHNAAIGVALSDLPASIDTALLIGRWAYYAQGAGVGVDAENLVTLEATNTADFSGETRPELLEGAFRQTLGALERANLNSFVLRQVPEIFDFLSLEAARTLAYGQMDLAELVATKGQSTRSELMIRNQEVDQIFGRLGAEIIDSWPPLCTSETCTVLGDGQVRYFDNNHLTNDGAIAIRKIFAPVFTTAGNSGS